MFPSQSTLTDGASSGAILVGEPYAPSVRWKNFLLHPVGLREGLEVPTINRQTRLRGNINAEELF